VKVLVCVASKHGATEEIGERIAEHLCLRRIDAHVIPPGSHPRVDNYDACVIGSAIYMGRWMSEARQVIESNVAELKQRPAWLFSSGPVVKVVDDAADRAEGDRFMKLIDARDHALFAGRLDKESLGFGERTIVRMIHSPWGDYRPWQEIDAWSESIANELLAVQV